MDFSETLASHLSSIAFVPSANDSIVWRNPATDVSLVAILIRVRVLLMIFSFMVP